jgi:hypothetical protein
MPGAEQATVFKDYNNHPGPFFVFRGDTYYPAGGADDFVGAYPTLRSAELHAVGTDWWQVAVIEGGTLKVVSRRD